MTTAVELLSFIPTGATTARSLGAWTGDVINVKNFGALGDASHDDTANIQAAVDAAFGPITAPHGMTNKKLNKPLYFPAGHYIISAPIVFYGVSGGIISGAGMGSTVIQNTNSSSSFSGTGSITGEVLTITAVTSGALVVGSIIAGTGVTARTVIAKILTGTGGVGTYSVVSTTATGSVTITATQASVFYCNGIGFSTFDELELQAAAGGVCCDLDWHQTSGSPQGTTVVLCKHVTFQGNGAGAIGCRLGMSGYQADQSVFMDCLFAGNSSLYGIHVMNFNALDHGIYGGNIFGWSIGVYVVAGSVDVISGVGMQGNTTYDIQHESSDGLLVYGIQSESVNFFAGTNSAFFPNIVGCYHRGGSAGVFATTAGHMTIDGCMSQYGTVNGVVVSIRNSTFNNPNAFIFGTSSTFYNFGCADILNTFLGDSVNTIGQYIRHAQYKIVAQPSTVGIRTLELEAASLSDPLLLYSSAQFGNPGVDGLECTITNASPAVFTVLLFGGARPHWFAVNMPLVFTTTGGLPTGLTASRTYYVKTVLNTTTFTVSATVGGAVINTSSAGSGTHTIRFPRMMAKGDIVLNNTVAAGGSPGWICTTAGPMVSDGTLVAVLKAMANVAA